MDNHNIMVHNTRHQLMDRKGKAGVAPIR